MVGHVGPSRVLEVTDGAGMWPDALVHPLMIYQTLLARERLAAA